MKRICEDTGIFPPGWRENLFGDDDDDAIAFDDDDDDDAIAFDDDDDDDDAIGFAHFLLRLQP